MHMVAKFAAHAASFRAAAFLCFVVMSSALMLALAPPAIAGTLDDDPASQQAAPLRPTLAPDAPPSPQAMLLMQTPRGPVGVQFRLAPGVVLTAAAAGSPIATASPANDNAPPPTLTTVLESLASLLVTLLGGMVVWAAREYASKNAVARVIADLTADEKHRATLNQITRAGFNLAMVKLGVTPDQLAKKIENETEKSKVLEFVKEYVVEHAPAALEHFGMDDDSDGVPDFIQARLPHLPPPDGAPANTNAPSTPKAA